MNKTFTLDELTTFVRGLIDTAKKDDRHAIIWFEPTMESKIRIVGGWQDGWAANMYDDLFCMSKSQPTKTMCIKICVCDGPADIYSEFDSLVMPVSTDGFADTSLVLEWEDNPEMVAEFFMAEWERITEQFEVN